MGPFCSPPTPHLLSAHFTSTPQQTSKKTNNDDTKKKPKPGKTKKPASKPDKLLWVNVFRCFLCQREGPSPPLRKCSQCEVAYYCSKTCQKAHWKVHKPACIAAVAAKAQDAARQRLARAVREKGKDKVKGAEDDAMCVICLGPPVDPVEVSVWAFVWFLLPPV